MQDRNEMTWVETDVLVIGGGTAGCVAAIAAAEEGAAVILVENDSALGGVATRGGIHRYYYGSPGGLQERIDARTAAMAMLFGGKTMGFHPDAKRAALAELCADAGVRVYTEAVVYEVTAVNGEVTGAQVLMPGGRLGVTAGVTVDCTGNGSVVRMAGGKLRYGRELDGAYHNYSLIPRRVRDGVIGYDNQDAGWVDPYDPWDVSRAFMYGRAWIADGYRQGKRYFGISSMLGVREGGLIEGDEMIGIRDYVEDRSREDVIARSYSHLDNHGFDTGNESGFGQLWIAVMGLFVKGLWCDIPYGSLLPKGLERVIVAGRALSADRDVAMGVRMQKDMHKVGEAAGVAAAISVREGCTPRGIDRKRLQERLMRRGVLQSEDLRRTEGRNLAFRHGALAAGAGGNGETGCGPVGDRSRGYEPAELVPYLETDENWKAVWRLAHIEGDKREEAVALLLRQLVTGSEEARFCAAVTLALLKRDEVVPFLLRTIVERKENRMTGHHKCVPFWIAAFVLLRLMESPAAVEEALSALRGGVSAAYSTFLLDYIATVIPLLPPMARYEVAAAVAEWIADPDTGENYMMHGDRVESLRWNLELRAASVMAACGADGLSATETLARARRDPRGYVRIAASRLLNEADGAGIPEELGSPGDIEAFGYSGERGKLSGVQVESVNSGEVAPPAQQRSLCNGSIELGSFDTAVIGGSVAGIVCAEALSRQGQRVVLIESSSSLLTEVARSRLTRCIPQPSAGEDGLTDRLQADGVLAGGELEPVLAQLTADRWLEEAGVRVLFESRVLEVCGQDAGGNRLLLAHKNGIGAVEVARVLRPNGGSAAGELQAPPAASRRYTITATLLGLSLDSDQHLTMEWPDGEAALRLRRSFYEGETYLDISISSRDQDAIVRDGAAIAAMALGELRMNNVIPETAVLAYVADAPWPSWTMEGTVNIEWSWEAEHGWFRRQLQRGKAAAANCQLPAANQADWSE